MCDPAVILAMLQMGDSAYPAGGFAFSWGVEGLAADGRLDGQSRLDELVEGHLALRWQTMDRVLLRQAFHAPDLDAIAAVDLLAETTTPGAEMRSGSRRAGRTLLGVSVKLGGALASRYRPKVLADARLGHLPVVQAVAYRDAGLGLESAEVISGWTLVTGLVGAAVRLGIIGHLEAQHSLATARGVLGELLAERPADDEVPSSFTPFIDIAVARGPSRHIRLFVT